MSDEGERMNDNPWRELLENCIDGSNYLRAGEYRDIIEYIDGLQRELAAVMSQCDIAISDVGESILARDEARQDAERMRGVLTKVRAHCGYQHGVQIELLAGLLASIMRRFVQYSQLIRTLAL